MILFPCIWHLYFLTIRIPTADMLRAFSQIARKTSFLFTSCSYVDGSTLRGIATQSIHQALTDRHDPVVFEELHGHTTLRADSSRLWKPVVDQLDPRRLLALPHDHLPRVPPLLVRPYLNLLKPPYLPRNPSSLLTLRITLDQILLLIIPPRRQMLPIGRIRYVLLSSPHVGRLRKARAAPDLAEDVVGVVAPLPVERTLLARALDPAHDRLVDVDVHRPVLGCVLALVLLHVQRDRRQPDGLAGQPAHALLWTRGVESVGGVGYECYWGDEGVRTSASVGTVLSEMVLFCMSATSIHQSSIHVKRLRFLHRGLSLSSPRTRIH